MYTEKKGTPIIITHNVFRRIFKEHEPPVTIFKPKKDQCSVCNAAERTKTTGTKEKYKKHIERKNAIKVEMKLQGAKTAVNNPKMIYGSFDSSSILDDEDVNSLNV